jgi:hypothetical protein
MTYQEATRIRDTLWAMYRETGKVMSSYPRLPNGLTPDAIKATPEWRMNKDAFDLATVNLQQFNKTFVKRYARELREERNEKFAALA